MTRNSICFRRLAVALTIAFLFSHAANAQFFTYNKGDLLAGFRRTNSTSLYELVVNLGSATNLVALPAGTTVTISNVSQAMLTDTFGGTTNSLLQWSVAAGISGSTAWGAYSAQTIWYTLARSVTTVQTTPQARDTSAEQQLVKTHIVSAGNGAHTISVNLGTTNTDNNFFLVREPFGDTVNGLTVNIGDPSDSTIGDYQVLPFTVENATPASFAAAERSDLYQSVPQGATDPTTGLTTGNAYFVGYFQFNPNGTMTFTRATTNSAPAAPILAIQRAGTTSTISFATSSGATYTLYFTNSSGLMRPVSAWPSSATTISGDGSIHSFSDTTTDTNRFYSVGAQ